jgi:ribonuclease HI
MKPVTIYTDGACEGNPGPGGWAAILIYKAQRRELTGACPATTNNRMELTAALRALEALKESCRVELHTDSQYLQRGMSEWLPAWKRRGWRRGRQRILNVDLWTALDAEASRHDVAWRWVRGHNQQPENERCDALAVEAIRRLRREMGEARLAEALRAFRTEPAELFSGDPQDRGTHS